MPTDEKLAFADRLRIALKRGTKNVSTASELANQFNLRHPNEPITPQAAQKWLTGKAIPTGDKINTLAVWLNVSAHWLHYGPAPESRQRQNAPSQRQTTSQTNAALTDKEAKLMQRLRQLSEHQFFLIAELAEQLAVEREIWPAHDE
ncbi:MAG: transcriptional regulator [Dechloromonas sp.]|nr:transcriptional regulator [Dechloromonas sp.]